MGGQNPIRVQSMTTVDTMDTMGSVDQVLRMVAAGCEYVRITAPSIKEAQNLAEIKKELAKRGCHVPLVADIHFTPNAAELAAKIVEKVRVNPGNYADKKRFEQIEYTDASYNAELERIREKFTPLVKICKEHGGRGFGHRIDVERGEAGLCHVAAWRFGARHGCPASRHQRVAAPVACRGADRRQRVQPVGIAFRHAEADGHHGGDHLVARHCRRLIMRGAAGDPAAPGEAPDGDGDAADQGAVEAGFDPVGSRHVSSSCGESAASL